MESNKNMELLTEDEIDIRELVLVLWKKKVQIICITLVFAIIAGLISFFAISPVYHTKMQIILNMPEIYNTKYGDYTLPITTNKEYIKLLTSNNVLRGTIEDMGYDNASIEGIKGRISISMDDQNNDQNIYSVQVSSSNPEEAKRLAETLYDNYVQFVNITTIEGAVKSYINKFSIEMETLEDSKETLVRFLEENEELLLETPETINQKAALNEIEDRPTINGYVVLENIINPNYTLIETDIVRIKQEIAKLEDMINVDKKYLAELDGVMDQLDEYRTTGSYAELSSSIIGITDGSVSLPSPPIEPSQRSSPNNSKNVVIAAVLGGMLAVIGVLLQWWWQGGTKED